MANLKRSIYVFALTSLVATFAVAADIYKSVDDAGVVTFSDTPPVDKKTPVERIPSPTAINSMQPVVVPSREPENVSADELADPTIAITSPSDNATIPMGAGIFDVSVSVSPKLDTDEQVGLYLDGEPVGEPQRELTWTLSYVIRGEHRLVARRISVQGDTVAESESITVYVLRPSVL